jgi:thiamine-phosphate pyrophosphorylase
VPAGDLFPRNHRFVAARGLYALADADAAELSGLDFVDCAKAMLNAGVAILQLRAKGRSSGYLLESGQAVAHYRMGSDTFLIQNDRADIADLISADGVHVGQDDLSVQHLRRVYPELLCGVSTHNMAQLEREFESTPDYVAFGPVFATHSKKNAEPPLGLAGLKEAADRARRRHLPLVAIGGVDDSSLDAVAAAADFVAVISMLYPPLNTTHPYGWIEARCRAVQDRIANR